MKSAEPALKHGVFLPPIHDPKVNPTLLMRRDIELASVLEDLGFDEYWIGEHHSGGYETISSPELIIAAAAERTSTIRLGTGVISLPYHSPLMVANRITQLDHMTRGRAMFGFGPGSLVEDARMIGVESSKTRGRMLETIDVIIRLMQGETVSIETEWFTLKNAQVHLRPFTTPHPEFAVASSVSPSGGRAAGTFGLSMLCVAAADAGGFDLLGSNWQVALDMAKQHGKTVSRSGIRLMAPLHIAETREEARENVRRGIEQWNGYYDVVAPRPFDLQGKDIVDAFIDSKRAVIGTPDDAIAMIERLNEQQGGFGSFLIQHTDWANWGNTKRSYELYAEYVIPHFNKTNATRIESWQRLQDNSVEYIEERVAAVKKVTAQFAADDMAKK